MKLFSKRLRSRSVSLNVQHSHGLYSGNYNSINFGIFFWLLFIFLFGLLLVNTDALNVGKRCVIHRDPRIQGNFYNDTKVREDFAKIDERCQNLNFKRSQEANTTDKSPNAILAPNVNLGIQLSTEAPNSFGEVLPAIDIAIQSITAIKAFRGITFNVVPIIYLDWLACDSLAILEQFDKKAVHVLFGPINDFALGTTARFSTALYSIPVVSPAAPATTLADKYEFGMLTRMYFTHGDVKWVLNNTLSQFGWNQNSNTPIALIAETQGTTAKGSNSSWEQTFLKQAVGNFLKSYKTVPYELKLDKATWAHELMDLPRQARIVILCADPAAVRTLMLIAHDFGFINGEYVFFNIDLLSSSKQQARPWFKEDAPEEENSKAREAYRALMTVTLRKPDSRAYHEFANEVKTRAQKDYNYFYVSNEINPYIGAFHDAVLLYAYALNDTLASNGSIWNGTLLTEKMRNRTFKGIAGHVSVDSNGDRNADYSLLDMNPETGVFEVVANYYGNEKVYIPVENKVIDWANDNNLPPPDTPPCGFDGTKCRQNNILRIGTAAAVIIFFLFISVIVGGIVIYRKAKFAAELKAMNWIITWEALQSSSGRNRNYRHSSAGNSSNHPDNKFSEDHDVVFSVETPPAFNSIQPERQFLLNNTAQMNTIGRENSAVPFSPTVTFESTKAMTTKEKSKKTIKKKRSIMMEHVLKFSSFNDTSFSGKGERSPPSSPMGETSPDLAMETNNHSSVTSNWLSKRQQRWSRKSDAQSHDTVDSNSVASGGWVAALRGGGGKKSIGEISTGFKRRRSRSKSHRESRQKPRRKKGSVPWDSDFSANKLRNSDPYDSNESFSSLDTISGVHLDYNANIQMFTSTTIYKGNVVALKPLPNRGRIDLTNELLIEVKRVKDLNYDHICRFVGACIDPPYLVYEYCPKGSLQDVLENEQIKLEWMFKFSLMQDICRGMIYLHHNVGAHGKLKSSNCLVDSRFNLKITDFGLHLLRGTKNIAPVEDTYAYYRNMQWTSPELLRDPEMAVLGTFKGDVYSFAIVCQEIVYRRGVFYNRNELPEPRTVIERVKSNLVVPYRPTLDSSEGCTAELVTLITNAWCEDPQLRPEFTTIKVSMRKLNRSGDTGNILDNLLTRMEQYANNLEECVAQRTAQYLEEKKKAEDLLYSMLPLSVATQLIMKQPVTAENFEMVTIYFSDIVEFTSLAADSTAMQVVELLNRLYTMFDKIIERFDVYKVETIGDAYVVASGLPQRNENRHAREIARMSIEFLRAIFQFKIPHRPDRKLQLRIGIHSGPVVAGVVGSKMPRYCLFGDTVNTSSRMESNGYPLKIHISHQTMNILRSFGTFIITERGLVEMKGKGSQRTYWLHGEYSNIVDPVPPGATLVDNDMPNGVPNGEHPKARMDPLHPPPLSTNSPLGDLLSTSATNVTTTHKTVNSAIIKAS